MTTDVTDTAVGIIRSSFLGGGFMAQVHSRAARAAGATLELLASSSPERAERAAHALGIARSVDDVAELLMDASDVVHICTPNATHADLALQVIASGRHVICEKPLATTLVDARALVAAADAQNIVAAVPFVYRYHPMVREARARVAAGEIGALLTIDCGYLQDWMLLPGDDDWRATSADGGPSRAFADIGSHLCDLLEFVSGERIVRLTARTRRVYDERGGHAVANEDAVAILAELASGAIGTLLISQMAAGRKNALTLELHGAHQSIRFDQERPEELWVGQRNGNRQIFRDPQTAHPGVARFSNVPAGHAQGYQDAFNSFVADVYAAIQGEQPDGLPTFADGLRAVALTEAVLLAADEERWVDTTPGTD
ncbi:Myo-inositol 2-dehydrogenase [Microbacterium esteraromaticum]|uniref:Myo-inositol 2-dehydrogenase n=1 Tax=Microbacterium esteraromaticum TaxID=57043 RepID=A0A1R4JUJ3_9MICO|nr:Gfo/Idh/MocA family oxidoreductase [Microbacterium esteraromaticum]SJN35668.1 Myo-inositol 2-dehydrogenase [Microbacterium esteraromaticum]